MRRGLLSISRRRARGRRDGLTPRRRKAQMAQNVSTEDGRQASAESFAGQDTRGLVPYGKPLENADIYWVGTVEMKPGNLPKHRFKLMVGLGEPERLLQLLHVLLCHRRLQVRRGLPQLPLLLRPPGLKIFSSKCTKKWF